MKRIFFVAATAAIFLYSCKKDKAETDQPGKTGQPALSNFLDNNTIVDTVMMRNVNDFELGMRFYSAVDGTITHLGSKMPYAGDVRVSLWDYASKQLLASAIVGNYPNKFAYADIEDINVTANKRYIISVNNVADGTKRPYYLSSKKSSSASLYPFSRATFTFEAFHSKITAVPAFPDAVTEVNQAYIAGFSDFIFK